VMLLIVATHCLWPGILTWSSMDSMFSVNGFIHSFVLRSSGYFIFISGFLFQYLLHKYTFKKYIKSKFNNIILPYLIISIPFILYDTLGKSDGAFHDYHPIIQVFLYYIHGMHMTYLWFVPMIVIFYAVAPLLAKLDKVPLFYKLLPVFVIISLLIPREVVPYHNPLRSFVHYFSIYVFGMFVSHHREQILPLIQRYWLAILTGFLVAILVQFYLRFIIDQPYYMEMAAYTKVIFGSLLMVYVFRHFDAQIGKSFDKIAVMSFGIYFVHGYVLSATKIVINKFHLTVPGNLLTYSLLFCFVLAVTLCVLWVMKKVLGKHSRKLVGY